VIFVILFEVIASFDRVKEIENALAARVDAELNKASGLPWDVPDPLPPLPHPLGYVEV